MAMGEMWERRKPRSGWPTIPRRCGGHLMAPCGAPTDREKPPQDGQSPGV